MLHALGLKKAGFDVIDIFFRVSESKKPTLTEIGYRRSCLDIFGLFMIPLQFQLLTLLSGNTPGVIFKGSKMRGNRLKIYTG